jgi:hypothetical protein
MPGRTSRPGIAALPLPSARRHVVRIVVIGGTGLIGPKVAAKLKQLWR